MNALLEKTERLLDEPWLERDISTIRTRARRVRARQRRTAALGALAFVLVLGAGVLAASDAARDGAPATLDVADVPVAPADVTVMVYLEPERTSAEVAQFSQDLVEDPAVVQAWFRSQDLLYEDFVCGFPHEAATRDDVIPSILPTSFDVVLTSSDRDSTEAFVDRMRARGGIEEIVVKPTPDEVAMSGTSLLWRPALRTMGCLGNDLAGEPIK
jgi:hypothetical protein